VTFEAVGGAPAAFFSVDGPWEIPVESTMVLVVEGATEVLRLHASDVVDDGAVTQAEVVALSRRLLRGRFVATGAGVRLELRSAEWEEAEVTGAFAEALELGSLSSPRPVAGLPAEWILAETVDAWSDDAFEIGDVEVDVDTFEWAGAEESFVEGPLELFEWAGAFPSIYAEDPLELFEWAAAPASFDDGPLELFDWVGALDAFVEGPLEDFGPYDPATHVVSLLQNAADRYILVVAGFPPLVYDHNGGGTVPGLAILLATSWGASGVALSFVSSGSTVRVTPLSSGVVPVVTTPTTHLLSVGFARVVLGGWTGTSAALPT
jgi:hypothetical protein